MAQPDPRSARTASAPPFDNLAQTPVGTWRLVSWEAHGADGSVWYPMGEAVVGYLLYTADGYMAAHLMGPGRTGFASRDVLRPDAEEAVAAIGSYVAYCGAYEIIASGIVVHHVELSLPPHWIGADQERFFELTGNRLTISTRPIRATGQGGTHQLVWERARPEAQSSSGG